MPDGRRLVLLAGTATASMLTLFLLGLQLLLVPSFYGVHGLTVPGRCVELAVKDAAGWQELEKRLQLQASDRTPSEGPRGFLLTDFTRAPGEADLYLAQRAQNNNLYLHKWARADVVGLKFVPVDKEGPCREFVRPID